MKTVRVGSRESKLAVVQAQLIMDAVMRSDPDIVPQLITMKTTGDKILDRSLDKIGGKGLFVKELDAALLQNEVDICVHSCKDLPMGDNPELPIVAVAVREDARDVLILPEGATEPDFTRPVGCSSVRRTLQLAELYPSWEVRPVRGNILTRLEKLENGEFGGLVLAAAGIKRLGLWKRVHRVFKIDEMLPAACQGILAIQSREGEDVHYLQRVHCPDTWDIAQAERSFVETLDGGCSAPVAAYGRLRGDKIILRGMYVAQDGTIHKGQMSDVRAHGRELGRSLAEKLKQQGERNG